MQITILCKVVDNFGDIGVVYRLAKQLKKINPENQINLIVDNLDSFNKICSGVQCGLPLQQVEDFNVYDWNAEEFCHDAFSRNDGELMPVILECFQCGRPDWMERILFEEKLQRTVYIIMIDYLTAEKYAEDFHCLQSLTRSSKVKKVNFMPGFTEHTGGLIIDDEWKELPPYNKDGPVLEFTYKTKSAYLDNIKLPYMPQTQWDKMMKQCSALFVRGEESMSRACLSGIPFVWQAYPQSEEYQLVKVKALLERMRPHFAPEDFEIVEKAWMEINASSLRAEGEAIHSSVYTSFFNAIPCLVPSFQSFAQSLRKNGDVCTNLMTFIEKLAII